MEKILAALSGHPPGRTAFGDQNKAHFLVFFTGAFFFATGLAAFFGAHLPHAISFDLLWDFIPILIC